MAGELKISQDALKLYNTFRTYANGSRRVDLTMFALREMGIRLGGVFMVHLIELKDAGLIRYYVGDIPAIELLQQ